MFENRERGLLSRWRTPVRPEWLALALAAYCLVILNTPFWTHLTSIYQIRGWTDWGTIAIAGVMLLLALWFLFNALAHRFVFKPISAVLLLLAGVSSYFGTTFGTLFDWTMIQNVLETDRHEAADLINLHLVSRIALLVVPALVLLALVRVNYRPVRAEVWAKTLMSMSVAGGILVLALAIGGPLLSISREHNDLRHRLGPINILASSLSYWRKWADKAPTGPPAVIAGDARPRDNAQKAPSRVLVIVVGETARAESFSVHGYKRPTNPRMSALEGLIAFNNASSCGTSTAHSVPCMFSNLGRENFSGNQAARQENLLDVLQRAGVFTEWRDNQAGSKGVSARMNAHVQTNTPAAKGGYGESDTLDMVLLEGLEKRIEATEQDIVVVLHMMGSHGPAYFKRYDPATAPFLPACQSTQFSACTNQELINAYDNSIHYTDQVLGALAELLKRIDARGRPTGFVYMSDHGESLGERGIYLHGMPYAIAPRQQTWIPFLMWLSPSFRSAVHLDQGCVMGERDKPTSHDNLFHTALGLFDVSTQAYRADLDVLARCRRPS